MICTVYHGCDPNVFKPQGLEVCSNFKCKALLPEKRLNSYM